jgi:plastocyanin
VGDRGASRGAEAGRRANLLKAFGVALVALVVGLIAGIGVGYAAWHGGMGIGGMMGGDMGSMMGSGTTERSGPAAVSGAQTIDVVAREFSFTPDHLTLRAGRTVNVRFSDAGGMFHTFTLAGGRSFNLQANPGESISGALTIGKPGTYQFICSVAGHAQQGMRGTITVT